MPNYKVTRHHTVWETAIIEAKDETEAYEIAIDDDWIDWKEDEGDSNVTIEWIRLAEET